jgi:hypothetical protein
MSGRLRKTAKRERNGRVQRELAEARREERHNRTRLLELRARHVPATVPKGLPALSPDLYLDPRCTDPLGLLFLLKELTDRQYTNGLRYRETARAYRLVQGMPSGLPKALGEKGISHFEANERTVEAIRRRYLAYRHSIKRVTGIGGLALVHRVCVQEQQLLDNDEVAIVRKALAALSSRKERSRLISKLTGSADRRTLAMR